MRTTTEILAAIKLAGAKDRAYNRVLNEGGEGYERDSTEALQAEYFEAEKAEFAAIWTNEVTVARRATWNAEMMALSAKKIPMTGKLMTATIAKLGFSLLDLKRGMKLHNIT